MNLSFLRPRLLYLSLTLVAVAAGLLSRRFPQLLPAVLAPYFGDTLWAVMVYFLTRAVAPRRSIQFSGLGALLFCFLVELSQLYHAPWIDAVRHTRLGGLVLGFGFLWSDLFCYAAGVIITMLLEGFARRKDR